MGNILISPFFSFYIILSQCWNSVTTSYLRFQRGISSSSRFNDILSRCRSLLRFAETPISSSSAASFDDELITEILSRVPVKDLVRFRCVCRSWRDLICSDPYFARQQARNLPKLKFLETVNPVRSIDFEEVLKVGNRVGYKVPLEAEKSWVLGSCNGLICRLIDMNSQNIDVILWNPSTRETYKLPTLKSWPLDFYGFGYDPINEDFKVIMGQYNFRDRTATIAVFALKTGLWKTIGNFKTLQPLSGKGILLNGALHWPGKIRIMSFDLAEEKLQELLSTPPSVCCNWKPSLDLNIGTTVGNCLFLSIYDDNSRDQQTGIAITIWVMEKYGITESWTRHVEIPSSTLTPEYRFTYTPIWILENGQVWMHRSSYLSKTDELVSYNQEEDKQEKKHRRLVHDYERLPELYFETLVSLKTFNCLTYCVDVETSKDQTKLSNPQQQTESKDKPEGTVILCKECDDGWCQNEAEHKEDHFEFVMCCSYCSMLGDHWETRCPDPVLDIY